MLDDNVAEIVGGMAGILSFFAYVLYYISILQGKSRPSRTTWIILTVVGCLIVASYYAEGARSTIWIPVAYTIGPLIAAVLSIKYGEGGTTKLDLFCFLVCILSIFLWIWSSNPFYTLMINIGVDAIGMIPTLVKSFIDPLSEDLLAWWTTLVANGLNVVALDSWDFSIAFYPLYMVVINGFVAVFLLKRFVQKVKI